MPALLFASIQFQENLDIQNQFNKLEKKIAKLKTKFSEKQDLLQFYEKSLADNQEVYNAYLKSKATQQLLLEYQTKVGANIAEIERLGKKLQISKNN